MPTIRSLYIYPIKSLGGIEVQHARTTDRGFQYDRRWMLVDPAGRFMSQRETLKLARFICTMEQEGFSVSYGTQKLTLPWTVNSGKLLPTKVWSDSVDCLMPSDQWNRWFSEVLNMEVRLVHQPETSKRHIDPNYGDGITSLSDGFPYLLTNQSSLDDLNQRTSEAIPMNRFRPNVVIQQLEAYGEDDIGLLKHGDYTIKLVKPCSRCIIINTDQNTGVRSSETLATLAGYRNFNNKVCFGQNALIPAGVVLKKGDLLT